MIMTIADNKSCYSCIYFCFFQNALKWQENHVVCLSHALNSASNVDFLLIISLTVDVLITVGKRWGCSSSSDSHYN